VLDHDVGVSASQANGSFASSGAWWCGDESYGVRQGSANWDGQSVNGGSGSPTAGGRALALSYRHGNTAGSEVPTDCQSNKGTINALFFDGHVGRLTDRQSREIDYWYPRGGRVQTPAQGMTRVPQDYEIP
jgi:prepilin-type processing-associated H-X9-DG protein